MTSEEYLNNVDWPLADKKRKMLLQARQDINTIIVFTIGLLVVDYYLLPLLASIAEVEAAIVGSAHLRTLMPYMYLLVILMNIHPLYIYLKWSRVNVGSSYIGCSNAPITSDEDV